MINHSTSEISVVQLLESHMASFGYDVVKVSLGKQYGKKQVLEIFLDKQDKAPLTIDDCAKASRKISEIFDATPPVRGEYILEVSSPGIERPLTKKEHFVRFVGKQCKITMKEMIDGQKRFRGVLKGVEEEDVILLASNVVSITGGEHLHRLPLALVQKASLVFTK